MNRFLLCRILLGLLVIVLVVDVALCRGGRRRNKKGRRQSREDGEEDSDGQEGGAVENYGDSFDVGSHASCVDIPMNVSLCQGIGYTQMRLPNLLHHETLDEVAQQAATWKPLLTTKCHPDTQLFLCSLFTPVCLDQAIYPCRSLCEIVKEGCEPKMLAYGFPWPPMLECSKFPSDDKLCIAAQHAPNSHNMSTPQPKENKVCTACKSDPRADEIQAAYCQADFAARLKMSETVLVGNELKMTSAKKVVYYKRPDSLKEKKKRQVFYLENAARCECHDLASFRSKDDKAQFILMGKVGPEDRLLSTFVIKYDRSNKVTRRVLRDLKNVDCQGQDQPAASGRVTEGKKKGGRKNRKEERKEKRKEERKAERKMKRKERKKSDGHDVDDNWLINDGQNGKPMSKRRRKMERIQKREERKKKRAEKRQKREKN